MLAALALATAVLGARVGSAAQIAPGTYEIAGGMLPGRQPDGNSYVLVQDDGLIVVDTGRHAWHRDKILEFAKASGRPIRVIVNTHWHLDHVSGNAALREAYPGLRVYASGALADALSGFLAKGAVASREMLARGDLDAATREELAGDLASVEHGDALKPDVIIGRSGSMTLTGRRLDVQLAKNAATAGDVWLYDPATRIAFVGDLVTFPAAFLDTACPAGWLKALEDVATAPAERFAPGHGPVLDRAGLQTYRAAFQALIQCSSADQPAERCAAGWVDAVSAVGRLTPTERETGRRMTVRYVAEVLRPHAGRSPFCRSPPINRTPA